MASRRMETIVGTVVLTAIALLVLGLLWFNRIEVGKKTCQVMVSFDDAGGLRPGDPVTVFGFEKGKVKRIELNHGKPGIVATLMLDNDVAIRQDARFWLMDAGLMGDKKITLVPGESAQPLDLSKTASGERVAGLMDAVSRMDQLANQTGKLLERIDREVATPRNVRNISSAIRNLDRAASQLARMAEENRAAVRQTVNDANRLISPNRDRLDSTIASLSRASANLDSIARKVNTGQGTAGQLVNSRELYDELAKTNKQLQDLIADVKANPKRYLTVKVF